MGRLLTWKRSLFEAWTLRGKMYHLLELEQRGRRLTTSHLWVISSEFPKFCCWKKGGGWGSDWSWYNLAESKKRCTRRKHFAHLVTKKCFNTNIIKQILLDASIFNAQRKFFLMRGGTKTILDQPFVTFYSNVLIDQSFVTLYQYFAPTKDILGEKRQILDQSFVTFYSIIWLQKETTQSFVTFDLLLKCTLVKYSKW